MEVKNQRATRLGGSSSAGADPQSANLVIVHWVLLANDGH